MEERGEGPLGVCCPGWVLHNFCSVSSHLVQTSCSGGPCTVVLHDWETPGSAVLSWPGPNLGAGFHSCLCRADFSLLSVSA